MDHSRLPKIRGLYGMSNNVSIWYSSWFYKQVLVFLALLKVGNFAPFVAQTKNFKATHWETASAPHTKRARTLLIRPRTDCREGGRERPGTPPSAARPRHECPPTWAGYRPTPGWQFNRKIFCFSFGLKNCLRFYFDSVLCLNRQFFNFS